MQTDASKITQNKRRGLFGVRVRVELFFSFTPKFLFAILIFMPTHFQYTLPLLARLDDHEVEAWGKSFDWTVPEIYMVTYSDSPSGVKTHQRRAHSFVQPARALMFHGDARLKRLLLREDMFGFNQYYVNDSQRSSEALAPINSTDDLWNGVWSAAWATGDVTTIDIINPWVSDGVKAPPYRNRTDFLKEWARHGHPDHVAPLIARFGNIIAEDVRYTLAVRGRAKNRQRTALNKWMGRACDEAAHHGNLAWVDAVGKIIPEVLLEPSLSVAILSKSSITEDELQVARTFIDRLPKKPDLESEAPSYGFNNSSYSHSSIKWEDLLVRSWGRATWRSPSALSDNAAAVHARWIATQLGQAPHPQSKLMEKIHKESIPHVANWGSTWLNLLSETNVKPTLDEVKSFLENGASNETLESRLRLFKNWSTALKNCDESKVKLLSQWAGRFSGRLFPENDLDGYMSHGLIALARTGWTEGHALALKQTLPSDVFPSRKAHRL